MSKITIDSYRAAAKRIYHKEGQVEIDDKARISRSNDDGVYVQAWVWIANSDITKED